MGMKAVVISRYGGPEVLEVRDVPEPGLAPGEELIRVRSGGLNFADTMSTMGRYPGLPQPPFVAGRELCGSRASDGQPVMGYSQYGAFAELAPVRSTLLWPLPEGWSAQQGAAFPVNFFTAYLAFWKAGLVEPYAAKNRPKVLIHAVAGGVGTAAHRSGGCLVSRFSGPLPRMKSLPEQSHSAYSTASTTSSRTTSKPFASSPKARAWMSCLKC